MHGAIREIGYFSLYLQHIKHEEMNLNESQVGWSFTNPIRRNNNVCMGQPFVDQNGSQFDNKVSLEAHSFFTSSHHA